MELLASMHPKFLRFPGGNYLEGDTIEERFDWKATIGPLVDRPTHRSPWNYQSSDGLGLLEFLEWTEDLKIEPVLAVYAGYSLKGAHVPPGPGLAAYVDDALDEIEFVTGDAANYKMGRGASEVGAPCCLSRCSMSKSATRISLITLAATKADTRSSTRRSRQSIRGLRSLQQSHSKQMKPDVQDDHYYKRADDFFRFVKHYDDMDRNGPKIFVGEWATREGSPTTNLGAALGDAAWMTSMERNSDLIVMASYAPLFVNVNPGGMQWEANLIGYDAMNSYGSPSYYAQAMFAEYLGSEVPASTFNGRRSTILLLGYAGFDERDRLSEGGQCKFNASAVED